MRRTWLLVCLLGSACGDDDGGVGSNPDIEEVPAAFASTFCGAIERCLGPIAEIAALSTNCVEDTTLAAQEGELPRWTASIEAGKLEYNAGQLQPCLDEVAALDCEVLDGAGETPACEEVFVGQVSAGDPCDYDEECEPGTYCRNLGSCPGTCTTQQPAGESCAGSMECEDGLVCTGDGVCGSEPPGNERGMECGDEAGDCQSGLLCSGEAEDGSSPGTCRTIEEVFVRDVGESCDAVTSENLCLPELSCVVDEVSASPTFECVERSSSGGSCRFGVPDPCPSGEFCDGIDLMMGDVEGTCSELPGASDPCRQSALVGLGQLCAPGLSCVSGTCRQKQRNGATCSDDNECYSESCNDGMCDIPECG